LHKACLSHILGGFYDAENRLPNAACAVTITRMALSRHHNPLELEDKIVRGAMIGLYMLGSGVIAYWIGRGEQRLLVIIALLFAVLLSTIGLRHRAWMLILLGWTITGYTAVLPLPFSIRDIMIMLAGCSYVAFQVLSPRKMRLPWHALDIILFLNLLYLIFTLFHHPVGFHAFGSETIGARPYVNFTMAFVAYWVIVRLPDSVRTVSWAPYLLFAGVVFLTVLYVIAYVIPSLPSHLTFLYAATDINAYFSSWTLRASIPRYEKLADFGLALLLILCSYYPPRTLFHLTRVRSYMFLLSMGCILASGFRNTMLWAMAALSISCILYRNWRELLVAMLSGTLLLGALAYGQGRFYDLPLPAQRSLSFLPGQWSPIVMADVEGSTEGRFRWWKDIIQNRLIEDWVFGDGFGALQSDIQSASSMGTFEDFVLLTGAYHSGPLTAIRYVGLIGMILLYALMGTIAYWSVVYVRRCWGTPLQPLAIFVAVQAIWSPIHYTFVFGAYDSQLPQTFLLAALLRLLIRTIKEAQPAQRLPSAASVPLGSEVVASTA
jgi:hypothetical protein